MPFSSFASIRVPVGLEGEPSSSPLVFGPQAARTMSSVGWKSVCADTGSVLATPSKARTKWR